MASQQYVYLGPAVGPLRSLVLDALEQEQPLEQLKDSLSALDIARKGAKEPRELGQRLLDGAQHAVLVVPGAASRHGLVPPTAEAEAAALGELVAAAQQTTGSMQGVFALDLPLHGWELLLVLAPTVRALLTRVESRLGRRLVPPGLSGGTPASEPVAGPAEGQRPGQADLSAQLISFADGVVQRAVAMEGRQLSQLPARAAAELKMLALQQLQRRGPPSFVPIQSGGFGFTLAATQEDWEELRAAIRALRLPPAAGVLRCAACGAAEDLPIRKLRCCAACRQVQYCSTACQRADWPHHKAACKAARGSAEAAHGDCWSSKGMLLSAL